MIDPRKMTGFGRSQRKLEEALIFCVCVAGHNAMTTAKAVDAFLRQLGWRASRGPCPFEIIRRYDQQLGEGTTWNGLELALRENGIGCFRLRARCLRSLIYSTINLKTCTTSDLEEHPGIGPKTSRFFLLHTQEDARVAALDTHILKYLRAVGIDAPKGTPTGKKYLELERKFIALADRSGMSIADFDLMIWNFYTGNSDKIVWVKHAESTNRSQALVG